MLLTDIEKLKKLRSSPILFIENCCKIKDKNNQLIPFKLNKQQRQLLEIMEENRFVIVAKNRQIGISSVVCAKAIYLCLTQPGTSCLLMSYRDSSVRAIYAKLKSIYRSIPTFMSNPLVVDNKDEMKFANGSSITVATCGTRDIAHGDTIDYVHVSEISLMRDSVSSNLASIESALTPNGVMCLESTPQGGLSYFSDLYMEAERGANLYYPVFFSWIEDLGTDGMHYAEQQQYAQRWIAKHGKLPDYDELSEVEKNLVLRGCTYEAIAWRRIKISNFKSESKFNENFPVDAVTAFQSSTSDNVFSIERIHLRLNDIHDLEPIPMPSDLPDSLKGYYGGEFLLWGRPETNVKYYIGVDCSEGIGKNSDYSVAEIIDNNGFHAGEFRSNKIKPFTFAKLLNDLGLYFNRGQLVVEKASAGHAVLSKLIEDYHYYNLYRSRDYDIRGRARKKDGFSMNSKSKPEMVDNLIQWFEEGLLSLNSKTLLGEMLAFAYKGGKMEAATGHDDTVVSIGLAVQGCKEAHYYV